MAADRKTTVVIPTYNERENIERLIPIILDSIPTASVLVADDDSPDRTADAVEGLKRCYPGRVEVLRRAERKGIGPAYIAGFRAALDAGADYIVQMDADFSHPVAAIPEFLRLIDDHDMVLGSRYLNGITVINWPIERLLLSYFGNYYVRAITGLPTRDTTGGFKCWRRQTLLDIGLDRVRANGYAFQIEMNYRAWRLGKRIKELPIIFADRTVGDSKMTKRISLEALWMVWWLKGMEWLGRL